jgi:hypothetical protein
MPIFLFKQEWSRPVSIAKQCYQFSVFNNKVDVRLVKRLIICAKSAQQKIFKIN